MKYGNIKFVDSSNGQGVRVSLYVSGCRNHCKGCFNEATWDFDYGEEFTPIQENEIIEACKKSFISGLTILGGEPMEEVNVTSVSDLIDSVRWVYGDTKSIWLYTGYTFEELVTKDKEVYRNILNKIDCLVDGAYIDELKDMSLQYRGSSNQRIIKIER
jgi:anaerobic ribonucleoside-triphosphate reductase activating protein